MAIDLIRQKEVSRKAAKTQRKPDKIVNPPKRRTTFAQQKKERVEFDSLPLSNHFLRSHY